MSVLLETQRPLIAHSGPCDVLICHFVPNADVETIMSPLRDETDDD